MGTINYKFTKAERLLRKREFDRVFDEGKVFKNKFITLYVAPGAQKCSRLGLIVSKKIGNAVCRNRVKRLLREVFRLNKNMLVINVDIVIIPRNTFLPSLKLSDIDIGFKKAILQINKNFTNEVHHH
ncbi:MAG: ribonuclease P protein component [Planctomycetes bacterium]|nr:ribonuclease P protein component [Planctomycetota bacterium]